MQSPTGTLSNWQTSIRIIEYWYGKFRKRSALNDISIYVYVCMGREVCGGNLWGVHMEHFSTGGIKYVAIC